MKLQAAYALEQVRAYGTTEGLKKAWDTRGRGRKEDTGIARAGQGKVHQEIRAAVQKAVSKYGRLAALDVSRRALEEWETQQELRQPTALGEMCQELGIRPVHIMLALDRMDDWIVEPSDDFADMTQKVIYGDPKSGEEKAMALLYHTAQVGLLGDTVRVYRGVTGEYGKQAAAAARAGQDVELRTRGADSWTISKETARNFGEVVLQQHVPKQYVFSSVMTNAELRRIGEGEVIVAFPDKKFRVSGAMVDIDSAAKKEPVVLDLTDDASFRWLRRKK